MELKEKIKILASERRKRHVTQLEVSKMTGVSRPNISNFENGRANNVYLYDFYLNHFGGAQDAKKEN